MLHRIVACRTNAGLCPACYDHQLLVSSQQARAYARVGVPVLWLVDVEARVLTVHPLDAGDWRMVGTYSDETEARIPPFDAVPLSVATWWPPAG